MRARPEFGINDDFQCSAVYLTVLIGPTPVTVHHSCKDGLPAVYWCAVCLPGLRFVYVDIRDVASDQKWAGGLLRTSKQRAAFAAELQKRFASGDDLWAWAVERNMPRKEVNG